MQDKFYKVNIAGRDEYLPILSLPSGINICFFNLHGAQALTEHCAKHLAPFVADCDVLFTPESKALQLTHCVARILGQDYYAVARKSKKLYMQDGLDVEVRSITTGGAQHLYISKHDAELLKGKKVGIIDDVVSTGNSLAACEKIVGMCGGTVYKKACVLAEGDSAKRKDINYLATIPLR